MEELPKKRGGRREGAGRKSKNGEATTVKRIPVSLIPAVDAMIASSALPPDSLIPISRTNLKVPVALEKVPAGFSVTCGAVCRRLPRFQRISHCQPVRHLRRPFRWIFHVRCWD